MIYRLLIFLVLNFGALAIGGTFTGKGIPSDWYMNLAKAPWTPPGWVFGAAWTAIMICFSVYLALAWPSIENKKFLLILYSAQWILNVTWNPTFFYFHDVQLALLIISTLTVLIGFILFYYWPIVKQKTIFVLPYFIWLLLAVSLNAYIYFRN